jgi:hypothetical protein
MYRLIILYQHRCLLSCMFYQSFPRVIAHQRAMLASQRTLSASRIVHAPLSSVLKALCDPDLLISLSPLVSSYHVDSSDPDLYHITDTLTLFGVYQTQTTYTAKFTRSEDAMHSVVNAGLGTRLECSLTAKSVPEGTEVTEKATIDVRYRLHHLTYLANDK